MQSTNVIKWFPLVLQIFDISKNDTKKENRSVNYQISQVVFLRFIRKIEAICALWYKN